MPSDYISRKLAQTIFHAFDFAKFLGTPLNTYAVLNLRAVDAERADKVLEAVREKCRRWLKRQRQLAKIDDAPPLYVYTLENPSGDGVHVNWVLHVPVQFQEEFRHKLYDWLRKAQGRPAGLYDIDVRSVDPRTDKSLAKYVLKGTDPAFVPHFHLDNYAEPQGPIHGRRAGACMSLNKAARDIAGFVPKRHRNKWKKAAWAKELFSTPTRELVLPKVGQQSLLAQLAQLARLEGPPSQGCGDQPSSTR